MALCWFIALSRMSFGWLRPNGLSQPKDIQASAINHHKAICPILIPITIYIQKIDLSKCVKFEVWKFKVWYANPQGNKPITCYLRSPEVWTGQLCNCLYFYLSSNKNQTFFLRIRNMFTSSTILSVGVCPIIIHNWFIVHFLLEKSSLQQLRYICFMISYGKLIILTTYPLYTEYLSCDMNYFDQIHEGGGGGATNPLEICLFSPRQIWPV